MSTAPSRAYMRLSQRNAFQGPSPSSADTASDHSDLPEATLHAVTLFLELAHGFVRASVDASGDSASEHLPPAPATTAVRFPVVESQIVTSRSPLMAMRFAADAH